ncbi:L,D-transpeptidase family protein [Halovulum dunhuangense]|uniref:L,D-transpeptidase family protein n=1 Tax=Halovulum dunhuangense TaxID=1505036 RepID=A0A849L6D6_9RHOB|nr:L,D-transpeptidase family protein [Halovulum dunhuangense]NNU81661.1 L,D-transpeptidase family protein [Halovulum dunhuangense]
MPGCGPAGNYPRRLDRAGIAHVVPDSGKAVLVNIPAFELIAFEDGAPAPRSRVIVAIPSHPTPVIGTHTTSVRFRPTWRPTQAMVASGEYRDRAWPPWPSNPLGLLAVRLAPGLLVYLHDTDRRDLFAEDHRALSHGCVRVPDWAGLAAWLLDNDRETVTALVEGRRPFDVPTPRVPVTLGYYTRFPDARGRIVEYPDNHDRAGRGAATGPASGGCDPRIGPG